MKKIFSPLLVICLAIALFACSNNPPPREYFNQVVLNCNLLFGFAGSGLHRELASPSEMLDVKTGVTAPMKRAQVIQSKLETIESGFDKVKSLKSNEDSQQMLNAATALYEFVIPVYKNEYTQLAALYDEGAAPEKIAAMEKTITDKYAAKFEELYRAVGTAGKAYAAKHEIKVMEVNPVPPTRKE